MALNPSDSPTVPPVPSSEPLATTASPTVLTPTRALGQITSGPVEELPEGVILTSLDSVVNWCRKYSFWPMPFATACCGIELMSVGASRFDIARFGAEVMRFSPRQCDLMIVAGRVVMKMMPVLQRIWLQMPEPKWCISMGACASTGGIFDTYAVVQGIDRFIPVDVYIPGCPPRPEQILRAILDLQDKVQRGGKLLGTALPELEAKEAKRSQLAEQTARAIAEERQHESRFGYRLPGGEATVGELRQ
jgi:NADH-quinone oxidoreductase subunit B